MSASSPSPAPDTRLGDYRVGEKVSEGMRTRTYKAEQISVRRPVLLERIKPEAAGDPEVVEAFLGDVRAKAAMDHPVIGSVYEAVHDDEAVYYTREVLAGQDFEELTSGGVRFDPGKVAEMLRQIGEAADYLERNGAATLGLEPRHLVHGSHNVVRIVNLAVAGDPDPVVWEHDRELVAELLLDMMSDGKPGATRMTALLEMLRDNQEVGWDRIAHTAKKLSHELSEGAKTLSQRVVQEEEIPEPPEGSGRIVAVVVGSLLVLLLVAVAGTMILGRGIKPKERDLRGMVRIAAANVKQPDGGTLLQPTFWIDAHEVTIGEYARFLKALSLIEAGQRDVYDHPEQPGTKNGHEPADWAAMSAAASEGLEWEQLPMNLNCPVVNVDWWDAYAYASWRGGRLPTQEEWFRSAEGTAPGASGWGPVDRSPDDRTPNGVFGLAGNVAEWVRDPIQNPAFPMNPKAPAACGASYMSPRNGALARRWLPSRSDRRRDLGFRILRESAP
jgi:formylglycine-generating enzyme required for sulfatase activity